MATLQRVVTTWQAKRNQTQVTIDWHFTTAEARIKLKHLYPVVKYLATGGPFASLRVTAA